MIEEWFSPDAARYFSLFALLACLQPLAERGNAIMRRLLELAEGAGCKETWLGTEEDNDAAATR